MKSSIRLTRMASQDEALPMSMRQAWPVKIIAEGFGMDDKIFVYHIGQTTDPVTGDRFECIASVNQMHELPADQAATLTHTEGIPFYRTNVLSYVARTAEEAETIWKTVLEEVDWLVKNWNSSLSLQVIETAVISDEKPLIIDMQMKPPQRVQLSYHAAGTIQTDVGGKQFIAPGDPLQTGWLSVSQLGPGARVPNGARFYYNIGVDGGLQKFWPPLRPYEGNMLFRNGIMLPYGIAWVLTEETVWWLDFDPATMARYTQFGSAQDTSTPWSTAYVSRNAPGPIPTILNLVLFK